MADKLIDDHIFEESEKLHTAKRKVELHERLVRWIDDNNAGLPCPCDIGCGNDYISGCNKWSDVQGCANCLIKAINEEAAE